MGNKSTKKIQTVSFEKLFMKPSLVEYVPFQNNILDDAETSLSQSPIIKLSPYKAMPVSVDMLQDFERTVQSSNIEVLKKNNTGVESNRISFRGIHPETQQKQLGHRLLFETREQLNVYLANILKLKDLDKVKLYSEINEGSFEEHFYSESVLTYQGEPIVRQGLDLQKKLQILSHCAAILRKVEYASIDPEDILIQGGELSITYLEPTETDKRINNFLAIAIWLLNPQCPSFASLSVVSTQSMVATLEKEIDLPTVVRQLFSQELYPDIVTKSSVLEGLIEKYWATDFKMDSFHACIKFRPDQLRTDPRSWLFYKYSNKVYFFNLADRHPHLCSLWRKRKKILAGDVDVVYNQQDCELVMVKRGTKHLIKANQFELENHRSISDITIYQKLPVTFDNPRLYKMGDELYISQKHLYKLTPGKPRVLKEVMKQIGRDLCIIPQRDKNEVYVILQSRDFLKQGIKIWTKDGEATLNLAGTQAAFGQLAILQLHLEEVEFCLPVFFNVYLMMACNSLWILDLNYRCFFSYATVNQLLKFQENRAADPCRHNYAFQILQQNFMVKFPRRQQSNHCCIRYGKLHIIGLRGTEALCLIYSFRPISGSLVLESFQSLMYTGQSFNKPLSLRPHPQVDNSLHKFLVDSEDIFIYKYDKWCYESKSFLKLVDLRVTPNGNSYDFVVEAEPVIRSLKEEVAILNQNGTYYSRKEVLLLLHHIVKLYVEVLDRQMNHRNFGFSSMFFTADKQLKLKSWVEPPRPEHISDYKDFFLLTFNLVTNNQYEKLTAQIIQQNSSKFVDLEDLSKMITKNLKMPVSHERVEDIQHNLNAVQELVERELVKNLNAVVVNEYIFNPVDSTNALYAVNIYEHKLIRLDCFQEDEEFVLEGDYNYLWNPEFSVLYIMTENCFHSVKIEFDANKDKSDFKVKVEDEEFMPKRIKGSSLCLLEKKNMIYSFGGLEISTEDKTSITNFVCVFNNMKLSWEEKGALCYTLAGASAVASSDEKNVFLFGGTSSDVNLESNQLKLFVYNVDSNSSIIKIDVNKKSPYTNCLGPPPIVLPFVCWGDPVYLFYDKIREMHKINILELSTGGLELSFTIEEEETDRSFSRQVNSPKKSHLRPNQHRINFSCKDKNVYYLDSNNNLVFAVFKNIAQPYLEVTEMMKSS